MTLERRIERLEQEAGIRAAQRDQHKVADMSDEELSFYFCHGYCPGEREHTAGRVERQYTDNRLRVTIILEPVE